ncbi:unknown [Prevotella sp. CAG:924]|nr:unknown [Prevotella sp. CAG:924]
MKSGKIIINKHEINRFENQITYICRHNQIYLAEYEYSIFTAS